MIEIKYFEQTKQYLAKGNFNLGYIGNFKNEDFYGTDISVEFDIDDVFDDLEDEQYADIRKLLNNKNMCTDDIAKALTFYYNNRQLEVERDITQINNRFLGFVFENMIDCEFPFWEDRRAVIASNMPQIPESQLCEYIYSDERLEDFYKKWRELDYYSANTSDSNLEDIEKLIRKYFNMLDLDGFIKSIYTEGLTLDGANLIFQCSCSSIFDLICAAYAEIQADNSFYDWHNF